MFFYLSRVTYCATVTEINDVNYYTFQRLTQFARIKAKFRTILKAFDKDKLQGCGIQNHWRAPSNSRQSVVYNFQ